MVLPHFSGQGEVARVTTRPLSGSDKSHKKEVATVARVAGGQTIAK